MNKFQKKVSIDAKRWANVYYILKDRPKDKTFKSMRKSLREYFKANPDKQHLTLA